MQVNLDKLQLGPRIQTIREIKLHQYQTETFFHPVDGAGVTVLKMTLFALSNGAETVNRCSAPLDDGARRSIKNLAPNILLCQLHEILQPK